MFEASLGFVPYCSLLLLPLFPDEVLKLFQLSIGEVIVFLPKAIYSAQLHEFFDIQALAECFAFRIVELQ